MAKVEAVNEKRDAAYSVRGFFHSMAESAVLATRTAWDAAAAVPLLRSVRESRAATTINTVPQRVAV